MKIKVCTFNLRTDTTVDGINAFPNRTGRILECINKYSPDIIGFQECKTGMRDWLCEALTDYTVLGCGREKDYGGESVAVAYKKSLFHVLWSENFWMSATPMMPGSTYGFDQSGCPRITNAVCLVHRDYPTPFVFCNTHLDHKGKTARLFGSMQLIQYLSQKPYKFVLTGDFNAHPDAPEIKLLTEIKDFPITDTTDMLPGTFHGFGRYSEEQKPKIDYIFTNMDCNKEDSFVVPDTPVEGIYISDHNPVMTTVEY